eukprot:TRINITY_DN4350_c0_g2_i2.p1 TRINITY_DN4350_c0_g2~~TRINITY_DN4350_c0_g2_i2.p1  ORF type:complete len:695 (-),score=109.29 TRINITY_DN4350_c0_g2_i2:546-2630(-)
MGTIKAFCTIIVITFAILADAQTGEGIMTYSIDNLGTVHMNSNQIAQKSSDWTIGEIIPLPVPEPGVNVLAVECMNEQSPNDFNPVGFISEVQFPSLNHFGGNSLTIYSSDLYWYYSYTSFDGWNQRSPTPTSKSYPWSTLVNMGSSSTAPWSAGVTNILPSSPANWVQPNNPQADSFYVRMLIVNNDQYLIDNPRVVTYLGSGFQINTYGDFYLNSFSYPSLLSFDQRYIFTNQFNDIPFVYLMTSESMAIASYNNPPFAIINPNLNYTLPFQIQGFQGIGKSFTVHEAIGYMIVGNYVIRAESSVVFSNICGNEYTGYSLDCSGSAFNLPSSLFMGAPGKLIVTDTGNGRWVSIQGWDSGLAVMNNIAFLPNTQLVGGCIPASIQDQSLFFYGLTDNGVYRVGYDGTVTLLAGGKYAAVRIDVPYSGLNSTFSGIQSCSVAGDNYIYVLDGSSIRRVHTQYPNGVDTLDVSSLLPPTFTSVTHFSITGNYMAFSSAEDSFFILINDPRLTIPTQPILPPTSPPTDPPTISPTVPPTDTPTSKPTSPPTFIPPTGIPTEIPTDMPTSTPTSVPTETPTGVPTETPTDMPTSTPTSIPNETPTEVPTETPTDAPTEIPTIAPTQPSSFSLPSDVLNNLTCNSFNNCSTNSSISINQNSTISNAELTVSGSLDVNSLLNLVGNTKLSIENSLTVG